MSLKIINDRNLNLAVLYCSTGDTAFGPVIHQNKFFLDENGGEMVAWEVALAFIDWLPMDARAYTPDELADLYVKFFGERKEVHTLLEARSVGARNRVRV